MFKKLSAVFLMLLFIFVFAQPVLAAREDVEDLLITLLKEALLKEGQEQRQETEPAPPENDGYAVRAADLIKVEPKLGAAIRERPSARGKIITKGAEGMEGFISLYVEPQPIDNEAEQWYKAYFINNYGLDLCQIKYVRSLWNENSEVLLNNLQYLYVNTRDAEPAPSSDEWDTRERESEREFFARFERGRPAEFNVGDKVKTGGDHRAAKTIIPIKLYQEPNKNSKISTLPYGSLIIDLIPGSLRDKNGLNFHLSPYLGLHLDMQDHFWNAIIDARTLKLLGWADSDEYDFGPFSGKNPLPSLPYEEAYKNYNKIFIY